MFSFCTEKKLTIWPRKCRCLNLSPYSHNPILIHSCKDCQAEKCKAAIPGNPVLSPDPRFTSTPIHPPANPSLLTRMGDVLRVGMVKKG